MNEDEEQSEEQAAVDYFRSSWEGRDAIANIERAAPPAPDFVGTLTDETSFGLEVVTVTDEGLARAESVLNEKLRPELEAAAQAASLSVVFALGFQEWQESRVADRGMRRKLIADLVEFARGAGGQMRETDDDEEAEEGDARQLVIIEGVNKVVVEPSDDGVHVGFIRSAWGRGVNEIQVSIAAKDRKAGQYRANLAPGAQLWLLMVAGTTYANGVLAPPRSLKFDAKFDRVFFLDHWPVRSGGSTDKVVELPIRRASAT
jgi:hypothetical protein